MALLARRLRAEGEMKRNKPFRVAIIGYGNDGTTPLLHCLDLQKESLVEVAAICDIRDSTIKRDYLKRNATPEQADACHFYSDLRKMLEQEAGRLDIAFVCTPDFLHREQTEACLNAGLHVFCPPPLAENVTNARAMLQTAKRSGRLLFGFFQSERFPAYRYVRDELIKRHKIFPPITYLRAVSENPHPNESALPSEERMRKVSDYLRNREGWGSQKGLEESPFQSFYEMLEWRKFRKFGIGSELRAIYEHVGMMLDFMEGFPCSVSLRESPRDPYPLPKVTLFRFDNKALAESVLFGRTQYLDLFDEHGYQIHVSPYSKKTYVRGGWRFNPPGEKGILGKQIDMSSIDYFDLHSILYWESDLPEAEKNRKLEELDAEYRQYAGEDNIWGLPEHLINTDQKIHNFKLLMLEMFLSFFRKTDVPDTAFAEKAFFAQVIIDGVEQALLTGKPFDFSPKMFEIP